MKKWTIAVVCFLGALSLSAQTRSAAKKATKNRYEYAVAVQDSELKNIDWNGMKTYFKDKKATDSIRISIKVKNKDSKYLKSETSYALSGVKEDLDLLIENLKEIVRD